MAVKIPFEIEFYENNQNKTGEIHLRFTDQFQAMSQELREKTFQGYLEHLMAQVQMAKDENSQKGIITILEISEQLFPHLKQQQIPLQETIIVELGENAEGMALDELLASSSKYNN